MSFLHSFRVETNSGNGTVGLSVIVQPTISSNMNHKYKPHILYCELGSLHDISTDPSHPSSLLEQKRERVRVLTASTRNSEDFPAFCRPTMVTSISVALKSYNKQQFSYLMRLVSPRPPLILSKHHFHAALLFMQHALLLRGTARETLIYLPAGARRAWVASASCTSWENQKRENGPLTRTSSIASHRWFERFQPWRIITRFEE